MSDYWCSHCHEFKEDKSSWFSTPRCEDCCTVLELYEDPDMVEMENKDLRDVYGQDFHGPYGEDDAEDDLIDDDEGEDAETEAEAEGDT